MQKGYNTRQKNEILKFLKLHAGESFSARELIDSSSISAGEATVYRTLNRLTCEGVLKKFADSATGAARYQIDGGEDCREHIHLICSSCGKIIHLNCSFTHNIEQSLEREQSFELDCQNTVIYGKCRTCH
ncbi:MAG: transcriptional repressor [Clostridia bacterium]|nr:transcriptional repressor [Clostridia bacterium]